VILRGELSDIDRGVGDTTREVILRGELSDIDGGVGDTTRGVK
jgi:hypothetical protein